MNDDNIVSWSKDYRLKWSDFKAEPNPAAFEDAYSFVKYRSTWTVNSESFGRDIKFCISDIAIIPEFHRHLSWVRKQMATSDLLEHQQGHFDLAELLRYDTTKKIEEFFENKWYPTRGQNEEQRKQFAREDSGAMIAKQVEKLEAVFLKRQQDYDEQTDFGQNAEKQDEFNTTFAQLR
ncbi:hypothetical protein NsoK4_04480 [Nitrosopumilus sp. K4]|uniref:hypothetical protein n=1 Tax=Nitrosopumilus sp. K4 TaxID=2795383 RepID=UPI001BA99203|nr:hypothetical protein [Nitrosopumilus sp. K4]QUC65500.1 hypothetical protein NsoK4_04480 [Nitrosopumilus sp. K4]